jgi:hypothetical protein
VSKNKKYVHEIKVDMKEHTDISKLCDDLIARESIYLNPDKINKQQVRDLLTKLKQHMFKGSGCNKENK